LFELIWCHFAKAKTRKQKKEKQKNKKKIKEAAWDRTGPSQFSAHGPDAARLMM
jgi:hypothetical protein